MPSIFFVKATPSSDGNFAECSYYSDKQGINPLEGSAFSIPKDASQCIFSEADNSDLKLIGATYSTLGGTPAMNSGNFCPADVTGSIHFSMPTTFVSTKGVVLLFSNRDVVENIYPSNDPQITNDGPNAPPGSDR